MNRNQKLVRKFSRFSRSPVQHLVGWLQDGLMKRLLKNSGWLAGGTGFATVIGLIGLTAKTHSLGVERFGLLTVILAYVALMENLTSLRSWVPLIKFGADALKGDRLDEFAGYTRLAFSMDIAGAFFGFMLACFGARWFAMWQGWSPETVRLLTVASFLILFRVVDAPTGILRVFDRFKFFTIQKILESTLGCVGALIVWALDWGVTGFLLSSLAAMIAGRILLITMSIRVLRQHMVFGVFSPRNRLEKKARARFLSFGGWAYLSGLVDIPVKYLDTIILSAFLSLEASGLYRIIKQIANLLGLLTDPLYQAVYPQLSTLVAEGNFLKGLKYCAKIGVIIGGIVAPISLTLALTSKWWLGVVFGADFRAAWGALTLALLLRILTLPTVPLHALFMAAGYVRQNVWILALANILYLALLLAMTGRIGLYAPIIAWFIQVAAVLFFKFIYLSRHETFKPVRTP